LDRRFYYTGQFARRAAVSARTLRYYDRVGLLCPSQVTEGGYRLYTDTDFVRLQQILALKFLGFSLEEIKLCLHDGPCQLQQSLALQKAMMRERRAQLDKVVRAIEETERLLQANAYDWDAIVGVIQVIQMTQQNDWRQKYLTSEQLQQLEELSKKSYTEEQRQQITEWGKGWTEEDQQRATQRWNEAFAELRRLIATGTAPDSPAALAFTQRWLNLINEFTHGNEGIRQGLRNMYGYIKEMPAEQRPVPFYTEEEEAYLSKAIEAYTAQHP
jgi:DNA-binding transcriptional MerR regulator